MVLKLPSGQDTVTRFHSSRLAVRGLVLNLGVHSLRRCHSIYLSLSGDFINMKALLVVAALIAASTASPAKLQPRGEDALLTSFRLLKLILT